LLLENLLKHSVPEEDPKLGEALKEFRTIASYINHHKAEAHNRARVIEINSKIQGVRFSSHQNDFIYISFF
jgi:hypothetical protein